MSKKVICLIVAIIVVIGIILGFVILNNNSNNNSEQMGNVNLSDNQEENILNEEEKDVIKENSNDDTENSNNKILVAFFSRADENYSVGTVEVGNTEIMANNIAETMGADLFKINPVNSYPTNYKECTEVAQEEKTNNSRPEIKEQIENIDEYDTIFIGYPTWWGDMPMIIYTFLESYDFEGKTVIPFNTHEGSGASGTYTTIKNKLNGANVITDGLAIRGTEARKDSSKSSIENWLKGLGF